MANQDAPQGIIPGYDQNAFAIAMLQLCQISYNPNPTRKNINNAVRSLPPLGAGGQWSCPWGPVEAADAGNLVFVATYSQPQGKTFAAVVIRGTDLNFDDPVGSLIQLWEDFDALNPLPLPGAPSGALIAGGTFDGLGYIQGMTWQQQSLQGWIQGFFSGSGVGGFLAVTGHSLGACLATVVAPWLKTQLTSLNVIPVTFAGPTAGNRQFASYFDGMFKSLLYRNPFDVAPFTFSNLNAIYDIYNHQPLRLEVPLEIEGLIACAADSLWALGATYTQPAGDAPTLGTIELWTNSWLDQAFYQHHPRTYMYLLGGTNVGLLLPSERAAYKNPGAHERIAALRASIRMRREQRPG